jgi:hypothetical protein
MKRMKPDVRKFQAEAIVNQWVKKLTCVCGTWNRDKILEDIERLLRDRRQGAKGGRDVSDAPTS